MTLWLRCECTLLPITLSQKVSFFYLPQAVIWVHITTPTSCIRCLCFRWISSSCQNMHRYQSQSSFSAYCFCSLRWRWRWFTKLPGIHCNNEGPIASGFQGIEIPNKLFVKPLRPHPLTVFFSFSPMPKMKAMMPSRSASNRNWNPILELLYKITIFSS